MIFNTSSINIYKKQEVKIGKKVYFYCSDQNGQYLLEGTIQSINNNIANLDNWNEIRFQGGNWIVKQRQNINPECDVEYIEKSINEQRQQIEEVYKIIIDSLKK